MPAASPFASSLGFLIVEARSRIGHAGVELLEAHRGFECITSVTRVPAPLSTALVAAASALPGASAHYVYPPVDVHLTIVSLDSSPLPRAEAVSECARVISAAAPFDVRLRGLAITPQSMFVKAWDIDGSLRKLRDAVAAATRCDLPLPRRLLGFVNLVRFTSQDVVELDAGVRSLRRRDFGTFTVRNVEIVRTDKVLSADATRVLARARLGGDHRSS